MTCLLILGNCTRAMKIIGIQSWRKKATRRSKLSIVADVLDAANGGALKTHIMYGANLSFKQLENYLEFTIESNLLEKTMGIKRETYETTDKGKSFLQQYHEIKALLTAEENDYADGIKEAPLQLLRS